jgi:PEP-CTERM motif
MQIEWFSHHNLPDTLENLMFKKTALAAALALTLGQTFAATAFNNGAPDLVAGTGMTEFRVADNFTLGASFDITNIFFWSAQDALSAYTGTISWAIFSDVVGAPGVAAVASGTSSAVGTATGGTIGGGDAVYAFNISGLSFTLSAGSYWLSLLNGAAPNPAAPGFMGWATASPGTGPGSVYNDGGWIATGNEQAFRIDGTLTGVPPGVPEPGSLALVMAALAAGVGLRRASHR